MKLFFLKKPGKSLQRERGQVLVFLVLGIVGLIAMTGLAIDGGAAMLDRRNVQSTADAAALAGALAHVNGNDVTAAALNIATQNGYDASQVTVNHPPVDGPYAGDDDYVQVTITSQRDTSIGKIVGINQTTTTAQAVAHGQPATNGSLFGGNALVALKPTGNHTFLLNGGAYIQTDQSGLFVNSDSSRAMTINGGAVINTDTGIGIVGGFAVNGGALIDGYMVSWLNTNPPTISTGVPQQPVPPDLSSIPAPPAAPSCSGLPTITKSVWDSYSDGTHIVLQPGNYVNGITINGGVNEVEMNGGVYCISGSMNFNGGQHVVGHGNVQLVVNNITPNMNGGTYLDFDGLEIYSNNGGFRLNGTTGLTANRFRFYSLGNGEFTINGGSYFQSDNTFIYLAQNRPTWNGSTILRLQAPPQDDPDGYGGLLMYLPWDNTSNITFNGGSSIHITGSIIAPHSDITLNGSADMQALHSQIVGYTLKFNGGSYTYMLFDESENYGAPQPPVIELVE